MTESPAEGKGSGTKANAKFKPTVFDPPVQIWILDRWQDEPVPGLLLKETALQYRVQLCYRGYSVTNGTAWKLNHRTAPLHKATAQLYFSYEEARQALIAGRKMTALRYEEKAESLHAEVAKLAAAPTPPFPEVGCATTTRQVATM